ncbi:MAG: N-6 DNA methylase [Clostridiales bacterium]|nr:N-6 DNA methylase [Clostridiales bacterium]
MRDIDKRKAAKQFVEYWQDRGYEKGESQPFWIELLGNVFSVENPAHYIKFEEQVHLDHTSFIDGFIPATHVLIEQKGAGKDLKKPIKQSDGTLLTPFQQAQRYSAVLPYSQRPRWIVTCNFDEFLIYDMEKPTGEPESILLKDLEKEYYRLQFLVDAEDENIKKEMEISIQAGNIVGELYDELLKQYINPESEESLKSLNMLCVRLVFCLYAEDAGIFGGHNKFHDYIRHAGSRDARRALIDLFQVLDTKPEDRDPYMDKELADFPYVNGGLFADEDIEIPQLNDKIVNLLVEKASEDFDWSGISPTIFGAVFESTLNPETRRSGGMHYTSIENIHKVIDPLFLDDLRAELDEISEIKMGKVRENKIEAYRNKLANLKFLDPACGSGNFLTETYMSIRRLENEALELLTGGQMFLDSGDVIKVSIGQFYGIEINDFAVTVAKTALWIAESQMIKETENIVNMQIDFLPLKSYANIVEGNALRIDWETVVPKSELNYIMGNPPFVGTNYMSNVQREDMDLVWGDKKRGKLDFVACWYIKSADFMKGTQIKTALVSTNSICQGEQATTLWKRLFADGVEIFFAHRTFRWDSEASLKAHVHCVIVGFSCLPSKIKKLYDSDKYKIASNINAYLLDAPTVVIEERSQPLCKVHAIVRGSQATDNGFYLFTTDEKKQFVKNEPSSEKFFKRFMMGKEFINNIERWCLWMPDISPKELRECPSIMERVQKVKDFRQESKNSQTRQAAEIPWRFGQYRKPSSKYIAFAKVSSEKRRYIPFGFLTDDVIPGDKLFTIPNATMYMLGVLTSNVHMSWMRAVCGRLKSDYSYSTTIVYNNFPWPTPTDEQKAKIERTAQAILDARALYPDCSLADLYDELTMPPELRKAHQENDRAVMQAYGFDIKTTTESSCVAELMKMYQKLTEK